MKMNKLTAGYHMLSLMSQCDGFFDPREGRIIINYLSEMFPYPIVINMDTEMDVLSELNPDDYHSHFSKAMDSFYSDSTEEERLEFLEYAVELVKADNRLAMEENIFLKNLFDSWRPEEK